MLEYFVSFPFPHHMYDNICENSTQNNPNNSWVKFHHRLSYTQLSKVKSKWNENLNRPSETEAINTVFQLEESQGHIISVQNSSRPSKKKAHVLQIILEIKAKRTFIHSFYQTTITLKQKKMIKQQPNIH